MYSKLEQHLITDPRLYIKKELEIRKGSLSVNADNIKIIATSTGSYLNAFFLLN